MVPFMQPSLHNSLYDWNYTTVPQAQLNGRTIAYTRGRILGGSSSISECLQNGCQLRRLTDVSCVFVCFD